MEFCWLIKMSFTCTDAECKQDFNLCKYYIFLGYNFITFSLIVFKFFHYSFNLLSLSQSHRTGQIGRDHSIHLVQPPCLSKVIPEHMAQNCVQTQFSDISTEGDLTISLDNLFQCSVTHMVKKFFLIFLCMSFCPLPLVILLGTTKKSLAPSS